MDLMIISISILRNGLLGVDNVLTAFSFSLNESEEKERRAREKKTAFQVDFMCVVFARLKMQRMSTLSAAKLLASSSY